MTKGDYSGHGGRSPQPSAEPVGIFYYPGKVSFPLRTADDFALQDRLTREAIEKDRDIILHPERYPERFVSEAELTAILSARPSPGDE